MPARKKRRDEETARLVQSLASFGIPCDEIATEIGVAKQTLYNLYKKEIDKGHLNTKVNISKRLYKKAMDGDTASLIFLAKTRLGWREVQRLDMTSSDGSMATPKERPVIDLSLLSPEQIAALRGASSGEKR